MKYKGKYDIGEPVYCLLTKDIIQILKIMSKNTWINNIPNLFIEFLNEDYEASLEAVKYVPNIYFKLNDKFKNDSVLIKTTIKAFQKNNRSNEINIRFKSLKKRKLKSNE